MSRREHLDAVDAALEAARRGAAGTKLPAALRARIDAAARAAAARPKRGRALDFVLRAAAVAAAIATVAFVLPGSLEAAEFDAAPLVEWNARLGETVAQHLGSIDVAPPDLDVPGWPLAAAATVLLAAGLALTRRENGR